ncbi:MAG: histidinol dehydrogenase [Gammaproteobacteria bacterium]|nr:MAG: histidinol dehydrogenase [Gammaproteobacteria bacterium]
MSDMRRLATDDRDFEDRFGELLDAHERRDADVEKVVRDIVEDIRVRGDAALLEYTRQFDGLDAAHAADLRVDDDRLVAAFDALDAPQRDALEFASGRIHDYHQRQRQESWSYRDADGTLLGQQVTAIERVGVYVPGGKAAYPSSVLMNVIPARVAGVGEVIMTVPARDGQLNQLVLAAAHATGVDTVLAVGGAQAVAALAFGTETVPAVDKIVGPGNAYVAEAKRQLFGVVGIDMVAGPSEIVVLCDARVPVEWIAMDLFSQAEHDQQARAILLCPDAAFIDAVQAEVHRLLPGMERRDIIAEALASRGALIQVRDLDEGIALCNRIAPEHLELSVDEPERLLPRIRHAGAVFLGHHTPEALGDYCAGPNHVLPTAGTARFSSPLGVYDFQKRTSLIGCSPSGAARLVPAAATLARGEGLTAHARSAELRAQDNAGS